MNLNVSQRYLLAVPALLALAACSSTDRTARNADNTYRASEEATRARTSPTRDLAHVRFVDTYSGKANLYFGDEKLFSTSENETTPYKHVVPERHEFALRDEAHMTGEPLAKNSEGLSKGSHYTVIAYADKNNKPELRVVNDDESAPAAGKAKVRIIHAAPGFDAVNVYARGKTDKLASESRFSTVSTWQEVTPMAGPLEIRTTNKNDRPVRITGVTMEPGKMYTFVVTGGHKSGEPLTVTALTDNPKERV